MVKKFRNLVLVLLTFMLVTPTVHAYQKNISLTVSPVTKFIDAGESANFIVDLKTTGSNKDLRDVSARIHLPSDFELETKLEDLKLMGVVPEYIENTLVYSFPEMRTGVSERLVMSLKTYNGHHENDELISVSSELSVGSDFMDTSVAESRINASGSVSVAKNIADVANQGPYQTPKASDEITWDLRISSNKAKSAQMYIKEGSTIKLVDRLPETLVYVSDSHNGVYDAASHTVTWLFDAPSIQKQDELEDYLFLETIQLKTKVIDVKESQYYFNIENNLEGSLTLLDGKSSEMSTKASVVSAHGSGTSDKPVGSYYRGSFRGPLDGQNRFGTADNPNPFPTLTDTAKVTFNHNFYIHPGTHTPVSVNGVHYGDGVMPTNAMRNIVDKGYAWIKHDYVLPKGLLLESVEFRAPVLSYSSSVEREEMLLSDRPVGTLYLTASNGEKREHKVDYLNLSSKNNKVDIYSLFDKKDVEITAMSFEFYPREPLNYISGKMAIPSVLRSNYRVKAGFTGVSEGGVVTQFKSLGDNNVYTYDSKNPESAFGNRSLTIVPKPVGTLPIAETNIYLSKHYNGVVTPGANTLNIELRNTDGSLDNITGDYKLFVKVPKSFTLNKDDMKYVDHYPVKSIESMVETDYHTVYKIIVSSTDVGLAPSEMFKISIPIIIDTTGSSLMDMSIYAHSTTKDLIVPEYKNDVPTNTVVVTDQDELIVQGMLDEDLTLIKSKNNYSVVKREAVTTIKSVKGSLDDDYSSFGHTHLGGLVDYKLELNHALDAPLSKMVLIDVLPSLNDLGITDNVLRESKFRPVLEGPLELNDTLKDYFDVRYSESANPSRDELSEIASNNLVNPEGFDEVTWLKESEVEDFSAINSFKVSLKAGKRWSSADTLTLDFTMRTPADLDEELISISKEDPFKKDRSAWNSFAVAIPNLQVVEPQRVGIAVVDEIPFYEPKLEKTVEENLQVELNDTFDYTIKVELPDSVNAYNIFTVKDKVDDRLEVLDVLLNGESLGITDNNVEVTLLREELLTLHKSGVRTLEFTIKTKLISIELDENLNPKEILNEAHLDINNDHIVEHEKPVVVVPKVNFGHLVVLVNEGLNSIETLEKVEDYQNQPLIETRSRVVSHEDNPYSIDYTTKTMEDLDIRRLPVGTYTVYQGTVLEGYIKTVETLQVEVLEGELTIVEILNPKKPLPAELELNKFVFDDSQDGKAQVSEILRYEIVISNSGEESLETLFIQDSLKDLIDHIEDPRQTTLYINQQPYGKVQTLMDGFDYGSLEGKKTLVLSFEVKVKDSIDSSLETLINTVKVNEKESSVEIPVEHPEIKIPPKPEVPEKPVEPNQPNTGHSNQIITYFMMMLVSWLVLLIVKKKRRVV